MKFIFQIEVSGICNETCSYCPYPTSKRTKGLMSKKTFLKTMQLIKQLNQNWVGLHNFGEPLLHPKLEEFITIAKKYVDNIVLSTNGEGLTRQRAKSLKKAGLTELYLSVHNKKTAKIAIKNCDGLNLIKEKRKIFYHNWAKTAKTTMSAKIFNLIPKPKQCTFLKKDWVVVLWDGRINSCCIDMEGVGIVGSVYDKNAIKLKPKISKLCKSCHRPFYRPIPKYYFKHN